MYYIYIKRFYFSNSFTNFVNDEKFHKLTYDRQGLPISSFDTLKDAKDFLEKELLEDSFYKNKGIYEYKGTYILSNGEFSRPEFKIRKVYSLN